MPELNLPSAAEFYNHLREHLLATIPELADDPDCLLDTLEGLTSITDQLAELARSAATDEALVDGLEQYAERITDRRFRLMASAEHKRQTVLRYMTELELTKITAPDLTVSRRRLPPSVIIVDAAAIAEVFIRIKREIDKRAIKQALVAGETVAGAELTNGGETITIRI